MIPEISIAVITAIVSLLVAIVSLINSILSNRQNALLTKSLETLKFELLQKQETKKLSDDFLIKQLESLDVLVKAIQRMKDMVQLILNAQGTSLDTQSALDSIEKNRRDIFACYEEQLSDLSKESANAAHQAKNLALLIENQLREFLTKTTHVSEMSERQKQSLLELRNNLSDAQELLRDSKMNKLLQRLDIK